MKARNSMPDTRPTTILLCAALLLAAYGQRTDDAVSTLVDKASATACDAVDLGGEATEMVTDTAAHVAVQQGLVDQGQAAEVAGVVHEVRSQLPGRNPEDCRALAGGLAKVGGSALNSVRRLAH